MYISKTFKYNIYWYAWIDEHANLQMLPIRRNDFTISTALAFSQTNIDSTSHAKYWFHLYI